MLADGRCVVETFANPPVLQPNDQGVYELTLQPGEFMVGDQRHCGRTYNGLFPAPTIDVPARGDGAARQIRVNLRNAFTKDDYRALNSQVCTCVDMETGQSCEPQGHGPGHTCHCADEEGAECHLFNFNLTNLHAHGSHVRPDYATGGGCVEGDGLKCRACMGDRDGGPHDCFFADDVLSMVPPGGDGAQHRWDLDEDGTHHEGLHWYHPHIHGSTAIQVASGATGALIVRGDLDEIPGVAEATERVMIVMTPPIGFPALEDGEPCDEDHITFNTFKTLGDTAETQITMINGKHRPRMIMAPGQIERWRFLHGAFLDEVYMALGKGRDGDCSSIDRAAGLIPLTQIARDGITLPRPPGDADWPFAPPYLFMSPGYRVETILDGSQFAHGDTYCLLSARFLQADDTGRTDEPVGIQVPPQIEAITDRLFNGDVVAIVNVTDAAGPATVTTPPDYAAIARVAPSLMMQGGAVDPLQRCEEVKQIQDIDAIDQLSAMWLFFANNEGFDQCGCPDHNINCKNFEVTDRARYPYDRVLTKGAVDHWRIVSGFDGHPFHIHINPFLVCPLPAVGSGERNEKGRLFEPPFAHWRDTYLVNLDRAADFLTEYKTHTGDFVFHCHKLNHEDHGMMELIRICDPAVESCDTLCNGQPCHWQACQPGDHDCERARALTACLLNPENCPDAAVRCVSCEDGGMGCPPGSYCTGEPDADGVTRCVPGCQQNTDCLPVEACVDGSCAPAMCDRPCPPPQRCVHGACE
ncbi:MAG: multicopper oxidase domain-containing protein [bacterium]